MSNSKKSHKEVLIERLTEEGKVKTISPQVYSKSVSESGKDMTEVVNEFKVLDLQSTISASEVVLNF
jgi:hypothetical protein